MKGGVLASHTFRTLGIGIAIAGVTDPAFTVSRAGKPVVAVVPVDPSRDSAGSAQVAATLARRFTVTTQPFALADATVLVGDHLPRETDDFAGPVFAVFNDRSAPTPSIEAFRAPAMAPLNSTVPVQISVRATSAAGRMLEIALHVGDVIVDRATLPVTKENAQVPVTLNFTPAVAGIARLRVTATIAGTGRSNFSQADAVVDVRDRRWAVLFFDSRPSWMSTFVRRAIEGDNRFAVTSRVVTSRNISTDAGHPPGFEDPGLLELFDAVVVGAPEALTEPDVAGLEAFLRRRGGSVVLLLDQRADGPYQRLAAAGAWAVDSGGRTVNISATGADTATLRASELAWPLRLPPGAEVTASAPSASHDAVAARPVIWRTAIGAGQLVVSGALDAWRYREAAMSSFDRFWRTTIAGAANVALPPIAVQVWPNSLAPGQFADVLVTLRDVGLSLGHAGASPDKSVTTHLSATLVPLGTGVPAPIRLWPGGSPGEFHGTLRAPDSAGIYRLTISSNGYQAEAAMAVDPHAASPAAENHELLAAWATTRGGRALPRSDIAQLPIALNLAIRPASHPVRWYPMRSAWWLVPLALALSGEWWLRRRRGAA